eukprot:g2648.t1
MEYTLSIPALGTDVQVFSLNENDAQSNPAAQDVLGKTISVQESVPAHGATKHTKDFVGRKLALVQYDSKHVASIQRKAGFAADAGAKAMLLVLNRGANPANVGRVDSRLPVFAIHPDPAKRLKKDMQSRGYAEVKISIAGVSRAEIRDEHAQALVTRVLEENLLYFAERVSSNVLFLVIRDFQDDDLTLARARDMLSKLQAWLRPLHPADNASESDQAQARDRRDLLAYFCQKDSALFDTFMREKLHGLRREEEELELEHFLEALDHVCSERLEKLVSGAATARFTELQVVAAKSDLDPRRELTIVADCPVFKQRRGAQSGDVVEQSVSGIRDMLLLAQYLEKLPGLTEVFEQYELAGATSDPSFERIKEEVAAFDDACFKDGLTVQGAQEILGRLRGNLGENYRPQWTAMKPPEMAFFASLKHADVLWAFLYQKAFYGPNGDEAFGEQMELMEQEMVGEEYDVHVVLNFKRVQKFISPLLQARKESSDFRTSLHKWAEAVSNAGTLPEENDITNANGAVATVRGWLEKTAGDTLEKALERMNSIRDGGEFTLCHDQEEPGVRYPWTEAVGGRDELNPKELRDLVLRLRFVGGEKAAHHDKIRAFLKLHREIQSVFATVQELRLLGHPLFSGTVSRCEIKCGALTPRGADATGLKTLLAAQQELLHTWKAMLDEHQSRYSCLTFFGANTITRIAGLLRNRDHDAIVSHVVALMPKDATRDAIEQAIGQALCEEDVTRVLQAGALSGGDVVVLTAGAVPDIDPELTPTNLVGMFLNSFFAVLYPRQNFAELLPVRGSGQQLDRGMFVHHAHTASGAFSAEELLRLLLHVYHQRLPESFEVLRCHPGVTIAEMALFISRVRAFPARTFALLGVNHLSSSVQEVLVDFQMSTAGRLAICEADVSQIWAVIGRAGDGKTHWIRKQVPADRLVTVSINESFSAGDHGYILTPDFMMKMFCIHERTICGQSTVVEGETGVGKTHLIRMLSILWNDGIACDPVWLAAKAAQQSVYEQHARLAVPDDDAQHNVEAFLTAAAKAEWVQKTDEAGETTHVHRWTGDARTATTEEGEQTVAKVVSYAETECCDDAGNADREKFVLWYVEDTEKKHFLFSNAQAGSGTDVACDDAVLDEKHVFEHAETETFVKSAVEPLSKHLPPGLFADFEKYRHWRATLLAIALVYYLRLDTAYRQEFEGILKAQFPDSPEHLREVLQRHIDWLVRKLDIPKGIAKNLPLKENVWATIVCTMSKTPLIIIGPPGSSKTLSFNLVAANIRGQQSAAEDFRCEEHYPALEPQHYQCSRRSTSDEIERIFKRAVEKQQNYDRDNLRKLCVVFMDEAGLPDDRRESLKVLHYYLDHPDVGFVAISNHVLDAAKSNRAVSLFRSRPDMHDLESVACGAFDICDDPDELPPEMANGTPLHDDIRHLCQTYDDMLQQKNAFEGGCYKWFGECFGLRDFMYFMRCLNRTCRDNTLSHENVLKAAERNFNGVDPMRFNSLAVALLQGLRDNTEPKARAFVEANRRGMVDTIVDSLADKNQDDASCGNLNDTAVRFKLLIDQSDDDSMMRLFFLHNVMDHQHTRVLKFSDFPDDKEDQKTSIISRVKVAAQTGDTIVLSQTESLNESFYDLFNQHFKRIGGKYFCNIAVGAHSTPCPVHPQFQCIVHMPRSEMHAAPMPFLNRFEKFIVSQSDLLSKSMQDNLDRCLRVVTNELKRTG